MKLKLHDALGYFGCLLICGALLAFHWAFAVGFIGVIVVGFSVWVSRSGGSPSIEVRLKTNEDKP